MNWLLIVVIVILAWNLIRGYRHGALRMVFSLVSWILAIMVATYMTPVVSEYLINNTQLDEKIQIKAENKMHQMVFDGEINLFDSDNRILHIMGIDLPEEVLSSIQEVSDQESDVTRLADKVLTSTGFYRNASLQISAMCIKVIAFFVMFAAVNIILATLLIIIKSIEKIPLVGEINKAIGVGLGAVRGLLIVWLIFAILMLYYIISKDETINTLISGNKLLQWLYTFNPIIKIIKSIL